MRIQGERSGGSDQAPSGISLKWLFPSGRVAFYFRTAGFLKPESVAFLHRILHYLLPSPFDFWDSRNSYQQYFCLKGSKTVARSGGGSSGQRANHSIFGLGFALHDAVRPVPTHILVYDRDNRVIQVDTLDRLCLVALDRTRSALRLADPRLDLRAATPVVPDSSVQLMLYVLST